MTDIRFNRDSGTKRVGVEIKGNDDDPFIYNMKSRNVDVADNDNEASYDEINNYMENISDNASENGRDHQIRGVEYLANSLKVSTPVPSTRSSVRSAESNGRRGSIVSASSNRGEGSININSSRSEIQEKIVLLSKLKKFKSMGVNPIRSLDIHHSLFDIKCEVDRIQFDIDQQGGVEFIKKGLSFFTYGLELGANKLNYPVGINLDGWSASHTEEQESLTYTQVYEELYQKYFTGGAVPPELKLVMLVGGSATMFVLKKKMMEEMFNKKEGGMADMMKEFLKEKLSKEQAGPESHDDNNSLLNKLFVDSDNENAQEENSKVIELEEKPKKTRKPRKKKTVASE